MGLYWLKAIGNIVLYALMCHVAQLQQQALQAVVVNWPITHEPDDFVDSLHVSPASHHKIAEQLAEVLDPLVGEIAERKAMGAAQRASQ